MNRVLKVIIVSIASVLSLLGLVLIGLIIAWYPVIDRLYLNTCNYYPHTFKDCVEQRSNL